MAGRLLSCCLSVETCRLASWVSRVGLESRRGWKNGGGTRVRQRKLFLLVGASRRRAARETPFQSNDGDERRNKQGKWPSRASEVQQPASDDGLIRRLLRSIGTARNAPREREREVRLEEEEQEEVVFGVVTTDTPNPIRRPRRFPARPGPGEKREKKRNGSGKEAKGDVVSAFEPRLLCLSTRLIDTYTPSLPCSTTAVATLSAAAATIPTTTPSKQQFGRSGPKLSCCCFCVWSNKVSFWGAACSGARCRILFLSVSSSSSLRGYGTYSFRQRTNIVIKSKNGAPNSRQQQQQQQKDVRWLRNDDVDYVYVRRSVEKPTVAAVRRFGSHCLVAAAARIELVVVVFVQQQRRDDDDDKRNNDVFVVVDNVVGRHYRQRHQQKEEKEESHSSN